MKAEHRKELETNTLADKMGQMMTRVKGRPRRAFFIYLVLFLVVIGAAFWAYRTYVLTQQSQSEQWAQFYDGSPAFLQQMAKEQPESTVGKAARFQFTWHLFWDLGIKMMGNDARRSMQVMNLVAKEYQDLAKDCKDDPIFEPEALLMLAVVEESKAIQDPSQLEKAVTLYKELVTMNDNKYAKSAQGKFAQGRLDHLEDSKKRAEVASLYKDLQKTFGVPPPGLNVPPQKKLGQLPDKHPPIE